MSCTTAGLSAKELEQCLALLERAREMDPDSDAYLQLERAAASLRKTAKKRRRLKRARTTVAADRNKLARTQLSVERLGVPPGDAPSTTLARQHPCYVCREPFTQLHHYYDKLCAACGDLCLRAREARADLRGRRALVTGGRIKVGYAIALRLLRDGAEVHVTSRFPKDAGRRYGAEPDFADWRGRLHLHQADFRHLPTLLRLVAEWNAGPPLDIVINNAAQTVWRPPEYYRELWAGEGMLPPALCGLSEDSANATLWRQGKPELFPAGQRNAFGDPLDLRRQNSWVQSLGDIAPVEFVESQVVNSMAPFLLCSELKPSLLRSEQADRYIINVAAAEGQFARPNKSARHPHTNMAKAALNMLTCTSAEQFSKEGIYMVSVDPGWVSHEVPQAMKDRAIGRGFHTPLAMEDAAARLYHPILSGLAGKPIFGKLLKDYQEAPW